MAALMTGIPFTKMHGIGNDYVYVNAFEHDVADAAGLARAMADRHRGVGGDGLIVIHPPTGGADVRMRMYNADGSEAEMCGNGIRCVCKYAHDHGLTRANPMRVETSAGVLSLEWSVGDDARVDRVRVDMGAPDLSLSAIGVRADAPGIDLAGGEPGGEVRIEAGGASFAATLVATGNPHAVIFVEDVGAVDLAGVGPAFERHPAFPRRINTHFVQVHGRDEVTMRTWERGSGATLACGTGASAVCVAGVLRDRTDRRIEAHLPGGDLALEWEAVGGHVFMTGAATEVFSGVWPA